VTCRLCDDDRRRREYDAAAGEWVPTDDPCEWCAEIETGPECVGCGQPALFATAHSSALCSTCARREADETAAEDRWAADDNWQSVLGLEA
jgi:hypothetical protein